jgi:hypothetical protein
MKIGFYGTKYVSRRNRQTLPNNFNEDLGTILRFIWNIKVI